MFFCGAAGCVTLSKVRVIYRFAKAKRRRPERAGFSQKIRLREIECFVLAKEQMVVFLLVERTDKSS
jgi:hypothetical protein